MTDTTTDNASKDLISKDVYDYIVGYEDFKEIAYIDETSTPVPTIDAGLVR